MSTAVNNLEVLPPLARPAIAKKFMGKNIWAMGDQVLISGSNFVTMILLARSLGKDEFGVFTLCYGALLFANILQSTLITQPHGVLGQSYTDAAYRRFTFSLSAAQGVLAIAEALIALAVCGIVYLQGGAVWPLMLALVPAIIGWQCQEFVRRVMYTEYRFFSAFANDCVSYGGQTLLIAALWWTNALHATNGMYVIAVSSMAASLIGLWQIHGSLMMKFSRAAITESWHFGKWLAGGEILQWAGSLQMYLYLCAILLGVGAAGELRAAQILFGPTRVFAFYLGSVLPIRFARALNREGDAAAHRQLKEIAFRVLPLLGLYALLVAIFAKPLLHLVYSSEFAGDASILVFYSGAAFMEYVLMVITSALAAKRMTRQIFFGQLTGMLITGLCSWWIILVFGIPGAPIALGLSCTLIAIFFWRSYKASMNSGTLITETPMTHADTKSPLNDNDFLRQARVSLLSRLFDAMNRNNINFCVTHGYDALDRDVQSDVDCVIPASHSPAKIAAALRSAESTRGGVRVVQWFADGAQYVVVAEGDAREPAMVALHFSHNFELDGRVFYTAAELLASRVKRNNFFVVAPEIEFACILLNRATKGLAKPSHRDRLALLFAQDPQKCEQQMRRFWSDPTVATIAEVLRNEEWERFDKLLPQLKAEAHRRTGRRQLPALAARKTAAQGRRIARWLRPKAGFHIVFLGPDGVGKSTVIEQVRDAIAPAFLSTSYHTFAPSMIPNRLQKEKATPHALPPRSYGASLAKAAWWSMCYTVGYRITIHPERARGGFAMNHRYLLDAIVDPKRYRYSGPTWLLRAIWVIAPKPDLLILLDAPAEVIQARKKEVAFEETARQRKEYRALVEGTAYGRIIDASRPLDEVVRDVNDIILKLLAERVGRRVGEGKHS